MINEEKAREITKILIDKGLFEEGEGARLMDTFKSAPEIPSNEKDVLWHRFNHLIKAYNDKAVKELGPGNDFDGFYANPTSTDKAARAIGLKDDSEMIPAGSGIKP